MNLHVTAVLVFFLAMAPAQAAVLYAISGDDSGIPRRVNQIDTDTNSVTPVFDLGDGSLGYFGLAFRNDTFYTVATDGNFDAMNLHTFTLGGGGSTAPVLGLGAGFIGGVAFRSDDLLYAIAGDPLSGESQLYEVDLATSAVTLIDPGLGFGASGGLTWDATAGLLYALGSDGFLGETLYAIDPDNSPGTSTPVTTLLGSGIIGGVEYVPTTGEILAIGNELNMSELLAVTLGGGATPLGFSLSSDPRYVFSALTVGPAVDIPPGTPASVPAVPWLMLAGLSMFLRRLPRPS